MTAATIATGRGTRLAICAETTFGTTPSTPTLVPIRATRSTLRGNVNIKASQEFTTDRNTRGTFMTGKGASGRIEGEWIYGQWWRLMEGACQSAFASDVLKIGSAPKFYTIEETHETGVLNHYSRYLGCMVDTMELSMQPDDTVKIAFDILAREMAGATTAISGVTYSAADTTRMPGTTESISGVTWGGITATPIVKSFSLRIANNLRQRPIWEDARSVQFGLGMSDVTGEVECYFDDYAIYQEIYTQSTASLQFTFGVAPGEKVTVKLGSLRWGDGELAPRERDTDITVRMPFTAVFNSSDASSVVFTRAVA